MLNLKKIIALVMVSFSIGFMVSLQVKATQNALKTSTQYQRLENLADILLRTENERDALKQEVTRLKSQGNTSGDVSEEANIMAGLAPIKGPGIEITLVDSKKKLGNDTDTNLYIIHDEDLLKVLNELKAAGAEALAINDQRLIATSEVRCAGPTVTVNNTRIAAPYVIKAIGDPLTMENAINMRGGVAEALSVWGIQLDVKRSNNIVIPGYKNVPNFKYAKLVAD